MSQHSPEQPGGPSEKTRRIELRLGPGASVVLLILWCVLVLPLLWMVDEAVMRWGWRAGSIALAGALVLAILMSHCLARWEHHSVGSN